MKDMSKTWEEKLAETEKVHMVSVCACVRACVPVCVDVCVCARACGHARGFVFVCVW